jgi:hypothetical protein
MPHFFFHLRDGETRLRDRSGVSLPDAEAAWYQAYRNARDLLLDERAAERGLAGQSLEVEDDRGLPVWSVPLAEIVKLVS